MAGIICRSVENGERQVIIIGVVVRTLKRVNVNRAGHSNGLNIGKQNKARDLWWVSLAGVTQVHKLVFYQGFAACYAFILRSDLNRYYPHFSN